MIDHTDKVTELHFDVFVVGNDWTGKYNYLKELGVEVVYFPYGDGVRFSALKTRIYDNYRKLQAKADNHLPTETDVQTPRRG